jgi:methionyl-tRNA formyltransferase
MERIRQAVPDLVVVNGTSIIRPPILQCVNAPFINLHCGITPRYRGVHGAFWALWERNPSLAGVTLHHIDEGVDTGQVIGQAVVEVTPKDGFLSLPLCQYKAGINLLKDYLKNIELRSVYTDKLISKQWFYPTLRQYIKFLVTTSLKY